MTEVDWADMQVWLETTRDDAACCARDVKEAAEEGTEKAQFAKIANQLEELARIAGGLATAIEERGDA